MGYFETRGPKRGGIGGIFNTHFTIVKKKRDMRKGKRPGGARTDDKTVPSREEEPGDISTLSKSIQGGDPGPARSYKAAGDRGYTGSQ